MFTMSAMASEFLPADEPLSAQDMEELEAVEMCNEQLAELEAREMEDLEVRGSCLAISEMVERRMLEQLLDLNVSDSLGEHSIAPRNAMHDKQHVSSKYFSAQRNARAMHKTYGRRKI